MNRTSVSISYMVMISGLIFCYQCSTYAAGFSILKFIFSYISQWFDFCFNVYDTGIFNLYFI